MASWLFQPFYCFGGDAKMRHKKIGWILSLLVVTLLTTISTTAQAKTKKTVYQKSSTPTVFFHGYDGTAGSFDGMMSRITKLGAAKKELVITINADGTLGTVTGELSHKKNNPMVQVLFADNENNEWNQAEWVKTTLSYLRDTYQVKKVNLLGHSMGGVDILRYLGNDGADKTLPTVQKFVSLGAPFNEFVDTSTEQTVDDLLQNGPTTDHSRYTDYQSMIGNIPSKMKVLLVAGQMSATDLSDTMVPVTSALAVHALLTQNGNQVQYKIMMNTKHSGLHESKTVDKTVSKFLWGKTTK
jgi:uncharacterized alpha/beta hydrolase family protein